MLFNSIERCLAKKKIYRHMHNENEPDDGDSSSSSEETTQKPGKPIQKEATATTTTHGKMPETQTPKPTSGKPQEKPTSKPTPGKTLKPSKPATVDCDKDHKVTSQDDKNVSGVLVVKSCHATRFDRKPSRCTNVGDKLGSLLNDRMHKLGIKDKYQLSRL